jgi:hypothetical protein
MEEGLHTMVTGKAAGKTPFPKSLFPTAVTMETEALGRQWYPSWYP